MTARTWRLLAGLVLALALIGAGLVPWLAKERRQQRAEAAALLTLGGDVARGRRLVKDYGCNGCHTIPGVRDARGLVGPRLDNLIDRTYVAGVVPNTADNLIAWIQHPRQLSPRTAMPELGVKEQDARDIAAFLYTRR
jgi:cytochrome c